MTPEIKFETWLMAVRRAEPGVELQLLFAVVAGEEVEVEAQVLEVAGEPPRGPSTSINFAFTFTATPSAMSIVWDARIDFISAAGELLLPENRDAGRGGRSPKP